MLCLCGCSLHGCKRLSLPAGGWRPKVGDVCPQAHACVDHRFTKLPLPSKVVSLPTCPYAFSYTWWKIGSLLEFSQGVGQLQFREIQCELPVSTRHCFARSYCPLAVCWRTLEIGMWIKPSCNPSQCDCLPPFRKCNSGTKHKSGFGAV